MIKKIIISLICGFAFMSISLAQGVSNGNGFSSAGKQEKLPGLSEPGCVAEQDDPETAMAEKIRTQHRKDMRESMGNGILKSCLMDYAQVQRRLLSDGVTIVDIRPEEQFDKYRVPGSLNIRPYQVKTKSYLKNKHLVLVGEKKDIVEAGLLCRELRKQGFTKVNIVKEGVSAWQGKLEGSVAQNMRAWMFGLVTPREFVALQGNMRWLVLDAANDEKHHENIKNMFEGMDVISLNGNIESNVGKLAKQFQQDGNSVTTGVLVVNSHGNGYQKVQEMLESKGVYDAYFLDGGINNYQDYMSSRSAFLARLKRGPVRKSSCSGA